MKRKYVSPSSESLELKVEAIIATSIPMYNGSEGSVDDDFMYLDNGKNFDWEE